MKDIVWKDIPGYEGRYQISEYGVVKSIMFPKIVFLKPDKVMGYLRYRLSKDGKSKGYLSHQLVAMCFLGHKPCGHKLVVDHIDNNQLNNHFTNLQIITQRKNASKDRKNGESKYLGVYKDSRDGKWFSSITINNKNKYLGRFDNEIEASKKYQEELKKLT